MTEATMEVNSQKRSQQLSDLSQFNSILRHQSHKILAAVPLESSNSNRRRHLVLISAPQDKAKYFGGKNKR